MSVISSILVSICINVSNLSAINLYFYKYTSVFYEGKNESPICLNNSKELDEYCKKAEELVIFLKKPDFVNEIQFEDDGTFSLYEMKKELKIYRRKMSERTFENNSAFLPTLESVFSNNDIFVSKMCSYVSCKISKRDSKILNKAISVLSNIKQVDSIFLREKDECVAEDMYLPFADVCHLINAEDILFDRKYTGKNLNVGFIESTLLNTTSYSGYSENDKDYEISV